MAIERTDQLSNRVDLQGLSTDTKPVTVGPASTYYEIDTGNIFRFSATNTNAITGNGWWEV